MKNYILMNPKENKIEKLCGFPSLFWKTWILKINQSSHSRFQRLPLHLLPKIFLNSFQILALQLIQKLLQHLIHKNLKIFPPSSHHPSRCVSMLILPTLSPIVIQYFQASTHLISILLSFHRMNSYPPYNFPTIIYFPSPNQHLWAYHWEGWPYHDLSSQSKHYPHWKILN